VTTAIATAGKKVPAFRAEATGGRLVSSKDLAGRPYVLYFYPKDDTPGCTTEGRDFAARHGEFRDRGIEVLGVSRDTLGSHEKFKAKHGLPFDLIADPDESLCRLFDVIREKNMYGRKVLGVERSTFLIDSKGVLAKEWRKVKVKGHVENVLEAALSL
jgi:thioredoxin-dependent peroxiredoxin